MAMNMSRVRTSELGRAIRRDPRASFDALYRRMTPSLVVWARVRLPRDLASRIDAEDFVQDVWHRACARLDDFDAKRASFRAWIFGIANFAMCEALRRAERRRRLEPAAGTTAELDLLPSDALSVTQRVARNEAVTRLVAAAAALEEDERRLLVFRGIEGLSFGEVAQRLRIQSGAAETRWRRLKAKLQNVLAEAGIHD